MRNLKYGTNELNLSTKQRLTHIEKTDLWLSRGRGMEEGWSGNLGLADANYDI